MTHSNPSTSSSSATPQPCVILAIESSCDETAAAVVRDGREVLSNVIATQFELHEEYGGVVPEIASRAHIERIYPVVKEALSEAGITNPANELDAVAVGHRPGLIGSLLVGVAAAKTLAWAWGKPIIGIDHVKAHLYAACLNDEPPAYPALGLIVSGGHTSLCAIANESTMHPIGRTIDDAVGEAYDKAAMMLGLGFPGGKRVDDRAHLGNEKAYDLPISRLSPDSLDFSFSGLKTALLYTVRGQPTGRGKERTFAKDFEDWNEEGINDLCASFQRAAIGAIMLKLERAYQYLCDSKAGNVEPPRSLIIGGGVSANSKLRTEVAAFAQAHELQLHLPSLEYCLDNAAMLAGMAASRFHQRDFDDLSLSPQPAGSLS